MLLQLATWPEVEAHLRENDGIMIPIGSTEQHGPNGMIGTDALTAEAIARRAGEGAGAMVGPTLPVGMAVHHMGFPGSMTLRPSTFLALIQDCVESLAWHGFRRFMFVNGHGGNIAPLKTAFSEIHLERQRLGRPPVTCSVVCWWENEAVGRLSRELYGASEGGHATPSEVAVTQHLYPEALRPDVVLDPPVAPRGSFQGPEDYRRNFPDGRIGSNPGLATPEAGARIFAAAVEALTEKYREFITE